MAAPPNDDAERALLTRLIDDAALFPPAQLAMPVALRAHARHAESAYAFVGGPFVVPASRLTELGAALSAPAIALSVILDRAATDLSADLDALASIAERPGVTIRAIELRLPSHDLAALGHIAGEIARKRAASSSDVLPVWFESGFDAGWVAAPSETATLLAGLTAPDGIRIGAKIRCGGPTANLVPDIDDLAVALQALHDAKVPAKATAGLHHPVRGARDGAMMHGFLNVFFAALGLHAGVLPPDRVAAVLGETDPRAFSLDPRAFAWRDVALDAEQITAGREAALSSYGSCSFDEPVNDLREAGWLG